MNDAERVGLRHAFARLDHQVDHRHWHLRSVMPEDLVEVVALQKLHHHEGRVVRQRPDIHDARDVLATQLDRRLCFAEEPLHGRRTLRHARDENLDRDRLVQIEVGRANDPAHAAHADHFLDSVLAEQGLTDIGRVRQHDRNCSRLGPNLPGHFRRPQPAV